MAWFYKIIIYENHVNLQMITLQEVLYKIQELVNEQDVVPIERVFKAFNNSPAVHIHIETLSILDFIEIDLKKGTITLTLNGKLTNNP